MKILNAKGVSPDVAIGKFTYVDHSEFLIEKTSISDIEEEIARFRDARATAVAQLGNLALSTSNKLGKDNSLLFEIH